jgi:hypothetical protein
MYVFFFGRFVAATFRRCDGSALRRFGVANVLLIQRKKTGKTFRGNEMYFLSDF